MEPLDKDVVIASLQMQGDGLKEQVDLLYGKLEERDHLVANAVNEQIILGKILDNFHGYTRVEDVVADAIKIYQELLYEGKDWVTWLTVSERMKGGA
jgi:hypothetical protein